MAQAILPPILFLSVWPHGWMDQDATWCEGRPQPMPHCVRQDPSPKKGHSSPLYLVHVYCGQLEIPDCIYNWIKDVFKRHAHCTKYARLVSSVTTIYASIIQGSALGPTSYIVTAADLHQVYAGNRIFKFADDTSGGAAWHVCALMPGSARHYCADVPGGDRTPAGLGDGEQPPTKRQQDEGDCLLGMSQSNTAAASTPGHRTCDQSARPRRYCE